MHSRARSSRRRPSSRTKSIAADHFPGLRVVATGSSTLAARRNFTDSRTGRKHDIRLVPLIADDLVDFSNLDIDHRMLRGGLPSFFLAQKLVDKDYERRCPHCLLTPRQRLKFRRKGAPRKRVGSKTLRARGGQHVTVRI